MFILAKFILEYYFNFHTLWIFYLPSGFSHSVIFLIKMVDLSGSYLGFLCQWKFFTFSILSINNLVAPATSFFVKQTKKAIRLPCLGVIHLERSYQYRTSHTVHQFHVCCPSACSSNWNPWHEFQVWWMLNVLEKAAYNFQLTEWARLLVSSIDLSLSV